MNDFRQKRPSEETANLRVRNYKKPDKTYKTSKTFFHRALKALIFKENIRSLRI